MRSLNSLPSSWPCVWLAFACSHANPRIPNPAATTGGGGQRDEVYAAYQPDGTEIGKYASLYQAIDEAMEYDEDGAYVMKTDEEPAVTVFTSAQSAKDDVPFYEYIGSSLFGVTNGTGTAYPWVDNTRKGHIVNSQNGSLEKSYLGYVEMKNAAAGWVPKPFRGAYAENTVTLFSGYYKVEQTYELTKARVLPSQNPDQPASAQIYFQGGSSYTKFDLGIKMDPATGDWSLYCYDVEGTRYVKEGDTSISILHDDGKIMGSTKDANGVYTPDADIQVTYTTYRESEEDECNKLEVKNLATGETKYIEVSDSRVENNPTIAVGVSYEMDMKENGRYTADLMNGGYFKNVVIKDSKVYKREGSDRTESPNDGIAYDAAGYEFTYNCDSTNYSFLYGNDLASYQAETDENGTLLYETISVDYSQAPATGILDKVKYTEDLIDALPAVADVSMDDAAAIEEAKAAYNALSDEEKAKVAAAKSQKLTDVAAKLVDVRDEAAARKVTNLIKVLPDPATTTVDGAYIKRVEAITKAYDALSAGAKAKIPATSLEKYEAAKEAVQDYNDGIAAKAVEERIKVLPDAADVTKDTLTDEMETLINAAEDAFKVLTENAKNKVDAALKAKLTAVVAAVQDIYDTDAAAEVTKLIEALPAVADAALTDEKAVLAAEKAFNELTAGAQAKISDENKTKLHALVEEMTTLHITALETAIDQLPDASSLTEDDRDAVYAARDMYASLGNARGDVDTTKLATLAAAVQKMDELTENKYFKVYDAKGTADDKTDDVAGKEYYSLYEAIDDILFAAKDEGADVKEKNCDYVMTGSTVVFQRGAGKYWRYEGNEWKEGPIDKQEGFDSFGDNGKVSSMGTKGNHVINGTLGDAALSSDNFQPSVGTTFLKGDGSGIHWNIQKGRIATAQMITNPWGRVDKVTQVYALSQARFRASKNVNQPLVAEIYIGSHSSSGGQQVGLYCETAGKDAGKWKLFYSYYKDGKFTYEYSDKVVMGSTYDAVLDEYTPEADVKLEYIVTIGSDKDKKDGAIKLVATNLTTNESQTLEKKEIANVSDADHNFQTRMGVQYAPKMGDRLVVDFMNRGYLKNVILASSEAHMDNGNTTEGDFTFNYWNATAFFLYCNDVVSYDKDKNAFSFDYTTPYTPATDPAPEA